MEEATWSGAPGWGRENSGVPGHVALAAGRNVRGGGAARQGARVGVGRGLMCFMLRQGL